MARPAPTADRLREYRRDPVAFIGDLILPGTTRPFREVWGSFQAEFFVAVAPGLLAVARKKVGPFRGYFLDRTKGTSKDTDIAICLLWLLLFARKPLRIEFGAGKRAQASETKLAMEEVMDHNEWLFSQVRITVNRIEGIRSRSICFVLTTDAFGSHGSRPDVTLCNELSHIENEKFAKVMRSNANKLRHNLMLIATNAGFLDTWQWQWREGSRLSDDWWFQRVNWPAPWIPEKNIEDERLSNTPEDFDRLWHGIWATGGEGMLDRDDIERAFRLVEPMQPNETIGDKPWVFAGGLDLGIKHDHSAFVVLGTQPGSFRVRLVRCYSWQPPRGGQVPLKEVEATVLREYADWNLDWVFFDPTQALYLAQRLREQNVNMGEIPFTPKQTDVMARTVMEVFRAGQIELYPSARLREDLLRLQIKHSLQNDQYKLDAIADTRGHADRAIALSIVLPWVRSVATEPAVEEDVGEHFIEV